MTRGARLYLFVLLVAAALVGGLELLPRSYLGVGRKDLKRLRGLAEDEIVRIDARILDGRMTTDDDGNMALALMRVRDIRREENVRRTQTGTVLLLVPISLVMLVTGLRPAMRKRRTFVSHGIVERVSDEVVVIDPMDLPREIAKLMPTKAAAVRECLSGRAVKCGYCGKRLTFDAIGRIGKRFLRQRPPSGVQDEGKLVGQGWWWRHLDPRPCASCGANDPQPV